MSRERGELKAFVPSVPALPRISAPLPRLHARYAATPLSVRVIRAEVEEVARECGLAGEALGDALLAVSEAATNAVVHGSVGREDAQVEVLVELTELEMLVTVSDSGKGLRPNADAAGQGAGLSIIAVLTGHLDIRSSATGTEVRMAFLQSGETVDTDDGLTQLGDAATREREGALQRLDAALIEQNRLGAVFDAAIGTSTELTAYGRLEEAGEQVAARQAWANWIETASNRGLARAQRRRLRTPRRIEHVPACETAGQNVISSRAR